MDVKTAVKIAIDYIKFLFEAEKLSHLGLEEVFYDEEFGTWNVTVGFSRPWDYQKFQPFRGIAESGPHREYKVVRVDDSTSKVKSVKNREDT